MKKIVFTLIIPGLLLFAACRKSNDGSGSGGSWTLASVTYPVNLCDLDSSGTPDVFAGNNSISTNLNNADALEISFYKAYPTGAGTYKVINGITGNPTAADEVEIVAQINGYNASGATYVSTGGTASVTVSGGKISISGSGVSMQNASNSSDNQTLSLNIHQTQ